MSKLNGSTDFRIVLGLIGAARTDNPWGKVKGSNPAAKLGLTYERRVKKELEYHRDRAHIHDIEYNPWFSFTDTCGTSYCAPDFLILTNRGIVVVEVKLTWVPSAIEKFRSLYAPVISCVAGAPVTSLIICKYLVPGAPKPDNGLSSALLKTEGLVHWPHNGHIPW